MNLHRKEPPLTSKLIYSLEDEPFGRTWQEWAAEWCRWLLTIPRETNPNLDLTGKNCGENQNDPDVWFLAASFGNTLPIYRSCNIPEGKAILFSILDKEDSFAENQTMKNESELISSVRDFMDNDAVLNATLDHMVLEDLTKFRVMSDIFDLVFPVNPVYDGVIPGLTRSVCDGYWVFLKPLSKGIHNLHFASEINVTMNETLEKILEDSTYLPIRDHLTSNLTFKLNVIYTLNIF